MLDWQKAKWFQPKELKVTTPELIGKLKKSLKQNGFGRPFAIWKRGDTNFILDGHHRKAAMEELLKEGVKIDAKLPAYELEIKNEKEAKRAVMLLNSHYADINAASATDWIKEMGFNEILETANTIGRTIDDILNAKGALLEPEVKTDYHIDERGMLKSMAIDFTDKVYKKVVETCKALMTKHKIKDHSELLIRALEYEKDHARKN